MTTIFQTQMVLNVALGNTFKKSSKCTIGKTTINRVTFMVFSQDPSIKYGFFPIVSISIKYGFFPISRLCQYLVSISYYPSNMVFSPFPDCVNIHQIWFFSPFPVEINILLSIKYGFFPISRLCQNILLSIK